MLLPAIVSAHGLRNVSFEMIQQGAKVQAGLAGGCINCPKRTGFNNLAFDGRMHILVLPSGDHLRKTGIFDARRDFASPRPEGFDHPFASGCI
jgi:hypothetical protein